MTGELAIYVAGVLLITAGFIGSWEAIAFTSVVVSLVAGILYLVELSRVTRH